MTTIRRSENSKPHNRSTNVEPYTKCYQNRDRTKYKPQTASSRDQIENRAGKSAEKLTLGRVGGLSRILHLMTKMEHRKRSDQQCLEKNQERKWEEITMAFGSPLHPTPFSARFSRPARQRDDSYRQGKRNPKPREIMLRFDCDRSGPRFNRGPNPTSAGLKIKPNRLSQRKSFFRAYDFSCV